MTKQYKLILGLVMILLFSVLVNGQALNVTTDNDQYIDAGSPTNDFNGVGYFEIQSNSGASGNGVGLMHFDMSGISWTEGNFSIYRDTLAGGGAGDNRTYGLYYCDTSFIEGASFDHNEWSGSARNCESSPFGSSGADVFTNAAVGQKFTFTLPSQVIEDSDGLFTIMMNATTAAAQQYFYIHEREDGQNDVAAIIEYSNYPDVEEKTHINISEHSPLNNSQYNVNTVDFNFTGNFSNNANVSLFINGTLNRTTTALAGKDVFVNFTVDLRTLSGYLWYFNATNISDSDGLLNGTGQTKPRTLYIDTVDPAITFNFPNGSLFFRQNLTVQFNITDDFLLFSYNITIDGNDYQGQNGLNVNSYSINFSRNVSNLTAGFHELQVRFADGHTAKELGGDYGVSNGFFNNKLKFDFWDGGDVEIKPEQDSIFNRFIATRKADRYIWQYQPTNDELTQHSFIVESVLPIHIIETDSEYKDYLIMGDHWMDFVLPSQKQSTVNIQRLDDYKVNVTVANLNPKNVYTFNSIGDLNVVTASINFTVSNYTLIYDPTVTELESTTFTFRINTTGVDLTNAHFTYNGTIKTVTKTSLAAYDEYVSTFTVPLITTGATEVRPFEWTYFLNSTGLNVTGTVANTQSVSQMTFDNCSTLTQRGLNISLKDDATKTILNGTIDAWFKVWIAEEASFREFNLSWTHHEFNTPVGLCFSPKESDYVFYSQFEYDSGGYDAKTYYIENQTLNNQTGLLDLFLSNSSSLVTFTVTDFDDEPVEGALIQILSFDTGTNTAEITEIIKTDTDGKAFGQIILNTQFYQFRVLVDGVVVLQSTETILTTTTKTFRINLATDFFEKFTKVRDAQGAVSYTNSTLNFAFDYEDPSLSITQACLEVRKKNINTDVRVNITCSTSSSGTIFTNIPSNPQATTYIGIGTFTFNDGTTFTVDTETVNFDYEYTKFGKSGIFIGFFMTLSLALIGIFNPVVAVILAVLGVFSLTLMNVVSVGSAAMISLVILAFITIYRLSRG